jgi:hypothetical protein
VREDATTPETIREIIRRSQPEARILRFNISGGELKAWTEKALRELWRIEGFLRDSYVRVRRGNRDATHATEYSKL